MRVDYVVASLGGYLPDGFCRFCDRKNIFFIERQNGVLDLCRDQRGDIGSARRKNMDVIAASAQNARKRQNVRFGATDAHTRCNKQNSQAHRPLSNK